MQFKDTNGGPYWILNVVLWGNTAFGCTAHLSSENSDRLCEMGRHFWVTFSKYLQWGVRILYIPCFSVFMLTRALSTVWWWWDVNDSKPWSVLFLSMCSRFQTTAKSLIFLRHSITYRFYITWGCNCTLVVKRNNLTNITTYFCYGKKTFLYLNAFSQLSCFVIPLRNNNTIVQLSFKRLIAHQKYSMLVLFFTPLDALCVSSSTTY